MKVVVAAVGRLKEPYLTAAEDEYRKRLRPYCTLTIAEARDEAALLAVLDRLHDPAERTRRTAAGAALFDAAPAEAVLRAWREAPPRAFTRPGRRPPAAGGSAVTGPV